MTGAAMAIAVAAALLAAAPWPAAEAARILAFEPIGGKSHWNFMSGVLRALVDGGHAVTVFTPFPDGDRENYTEVDTSSAGLEMVRDIGVTELIEKWSNPWMSTGPVVAMSRFLCDRIYEHPAMAEALRRPSGFDVVLVEPFLSDCVSYAAAVLDVPLVYVTAMPMLAFSERSVTGHLSNPAVVANVMADHGVPRTFAHRLFNAALAAYGHAVHAGVEFWMRRTEPRPYDLIAPKTPSLVFVNGHYVSNAAGAVTADVVNVGGVHLRLPTGLPLDILEFIEQSPDGVIYFTFGSTVKMSSVPEHIRKAFMEVLAQIPQRVLLKYEDEMEDKPKNVMIKKWFPQRDILLHPKVKLFISHGGISGLYEAVDAGVPVLGFPLFGDQPRNIDNLVNAKMAISMNLLSVTKEMFLKNVLELLNNKKYMENAETASKIFKDRPMSPEQSVVYWTEYVLRHKGAPHLKSHALNLTWYQYYLLDVILTVLIFISVVFFVTYKCLKTIYNYCFKYSPSSKSKSE